MNKLTAYLSGIIFTIVSLYIITGCDDGDDINELFIGKAWKITGATFNGKSINGDEVKELYLVPDTYKLSFSSGTFNGILEASSSFKGIWSADGKSRNLTLTIQHQSGVETIRLSQQIFDIISHATKYGGDSNVMYIYKDNTNFILLSSENNKLHN